MHVAFLGDEVPNTEFGATSIGGWCIIKFLLESGHEVTVCPLLAPVAWCSTQDRKRWLGSLSELGANVMPLEVNGPPEQRVEHRILGFLRRLVRPRLAEYYPWIALVPEVGKLLEGVSPDSILIYQSTKSVAATYGLKIAPRLALEGDPDPLPIYYRWKLMPAQQRLSPRRLLTPLRIWHHVKFIVRLLQDCDAVACIPPQHAEWLRRKGLPNCLHLRNLVPDVGGRDWQQRRDACPGGAKPKIMMIDKGFGTHGTAGYRFFTTEVLPLLEERLGPDGFEVHIIGRGSPPADLAETWARPSMRLRGYVKDVDAEFLSADVLLVPIPIELGHRGRIVYGWSFGCCVVAHQANVNGLPEMVHEKNGLIASDGRELAEAVTRALEDAALRRKLGSNGRKTYEEYFAPEVAGPRILAELERIARARKSSRGPESPPPMTRVRAGLGT